ncbi:hypothetical protein ACOMHN_006649 [Nucella lapillus]
MEDDTATMTSVTEDFSLDETDTSSHDIDTSSQITSSDAIEENCALASHSLSQHVTVKQEEAEVSMEVSEQEIASAADEEEPVVHTPNAKPSQHPTHRAQQSSSRCLPWGSGAQIFPQIPDFMSMQGKWYEHECFNHYWRHYHFVSMWCRKHMQTYRTVLNQYNNTLSHMHPHTAAGQSPANNSQATPVFKKPVSKKTVRNRKARRRRKIAKKRNQEAVKSAELTGRDSTLSQLSEDDDGTGETTESAAEGAVKEEDMEITDEMLDFFAHTHRHKQEREALKKSNDGGNEEKHVNIEESEEKNERTESAPAERPGSKRTTEMRLLYGKGAAMIHGMETALQMTFDRNIDVLQPSFWPNMPLRVLF